MRAFLRIGAPTAAMRALLGALLAVVLAATTIALDTAEAAGRVLVVTSPADSGPGSLREALETATSEPGVRRIKIGVPAITIDSTLVYNGAQGLRVDGRGVTITGAVPSSLGLSSVMGGGSIRLSDMTFDGVGVSLTPGVGPEGPYRVVLRDVDIIGSSGRGLTVFGADRSVRVVLHRSEIRDNEQGGILVFQAGAGHGALAMRHAVVADNVPGTGEEVLLFESGDGSALLRAVHSEVVGDAEGVAVTEVDAGGIDWRVMRSRIESGSEPVQIMETDDGDVTLVAKQLEAIGRAGPGALVFEGENGSAVLRIKKSTLGQAPAASGSGLEIVETAAGDLDVVLVHSRITSPGSALKASQDAPGSGTIVTKKTTIDGTVSLVGTTIV